MWHSAKKVLFCILVVFATSGPAYANSKHNFYVLTLSILSYSKWENVSTPTLCVIDNASITSTFQSYIQQLSYNYRVQTVNAKDFSKSHCQAVYFSTTPEYKIFETLLYCIAVHCACRLLEFWSIEISSSKNAKKRGVCTY